MGRTSLPPGFRFHPTDVELVMYYLKRKVMGKKFHFDTISELNIYKFCPWDLPDKSCLRSKDLEWFFFCPRERKYASGARTNRATENGYWKTTGKDRHIVYREKPVGMVRTLVFHSGHAPQGIRTDWVMHEYRIADKDLADDARVVQDAYVLCKVFQKSGPGPKNGAQYGAPFNEEDWNDDEEICAESSPIDGLVPAMPKLPNNQNSSVVTSIIVPGNASRWSLSESGPSTAGPSANNAPLNFPDNDAEINSLLAMFTEDSTLFPIEICSNENLQNLNRDKNIEAVTCSGGNDIYNGLGDLGCWGDPSKGGFNLPSIQEAGFTPSPMLLGDDIYNAFLELNDLSTPVIFRGGEGSGSEPVPTDSSCAPYKCDDTLEQFYYGGHCLGPVQNVSQWSQSPLLPEVTNRLGNHFDVLHRENGIGDGANQGYNNASSTTKGSTDAAQTQTRGRFCYFQ